MMYSNIGINHHTRYQSERQTMPPSKIFAAAWGAIIGAWMATPQIVQDSLTAAVILFTLDTLSGFILAGMEGRFRSRSLSQGAVKKALQYILLIGVCGCFGLIAHNSMLVMPGIGIVIMTEASSIIENVYKMEKGGAKMPGGLREMVQRLGRYLAVANDPPKTEEKNKE